MNIHAEKYDKKYQEAMIDFLRQCLPESGRGLDINGRHQFYYDIENCFEAFWCLFDGNEVIGTVGVKKLMKRVANSSRSIFMRGTMEKGSEEA